MQKKIYIGGLPWELDRIGLLNYFKAVMEGNDIAASYQLPFVNAPVENPNATIRVVDVFVANDRETGKSRGFGFITLELEDDAMFQKVIELINGKVVIGIRGPRDLIVNEADQKPEGERAERAPRNNDGEATENNQGGEAYDVDSLI
jgi:RNA recognition motif-containing protein